MIGVRWYIAGLLFFATVINYIDRQTLSIVAPVLTEELGITNTEYSNILTAFLVPYTFMYVVSGYLCDRWGTRRALASFMTWWSIANALHAFARGAMGLGFFRFLLGLGESGNFMAAEKAISEWFPAKERGVANGIVNAAAATGAIISPPLIAWVTMQWGWRVSFIVTGALGFVWLVFWLLIYHLPKNHPKVTPEELQLIEQDRPKVFEKPGYSRMLRLPQVWGLLISRVFADPVWWFYLFWLPKYLKDVREFSLVEIGMIAWLPYLSADIGSLAGGWFSGRLIARGVSVLNARRFTMIPCSLIMPVGILIAYLPSTPALALICLVTFCHMAWKTNLMTMTNDIFPSQIVGSAAGIVGLGSGLAGVISTPFVGRIVDNFGYDAVFWVMGVLHPIAMLLILLLVKKTAFVES